VNTITRAELVGIREAYVLANPGPADEIHIATDSQTSMYQIHKMITHPQNMQEHRHHSLLADIVQRLRDSKATLHLWKVTSHIGVYGNEMADHMAVQVAQERQEPTTTSGNLQSNARETYFWPYTIEEIVTKTETRREHTPIANLAETLKSKAIQDCGLGSANTTSVYYSAWANQAKDIHQKYSHIFLNGNKAQHRRRKLILQYRWGLLPTNKALHRYKLSSTDSCPLCGQQDGGHHALSACPSLSGAVTKRHNDAGSLIVQAIHEGDRAAELVMSDVGLSRRCAIMKRKGRIPLAVLPKDMPNGMKCRIRSHCKPDAMLVRTERSIKRYELLEIKYCRDTDPTQQETRAERQHDRLMKAIQIFDPKAEVKLTTIMLGVSGCIYKKTEEKLKELGVVGPALPRLLKRLHHLACRHVEEIWNIRHAAIQNARTYARNTWSKRKNEMHTQQETQHRKRRKLKQPP
jgi:ribonuclease HI